MLGLQTLSLYSILYSVEEKGKKRKEIKNKLLHKYRLVIINESTFEEKIFFKLSRLNVFVASSLFIIALIGVTILFIAFTPLREYIPGYSSSQLKRQATELIYKTDSIVETLDYTNRYLSRVRSVLKGDIDFDQVNKDSLFMHFKFDPSTVDLTPISEDYVLRAQVALEDKYNLFERDVSSVNQILFSPITGIISQTYDVEQKHYAVDIVAPKDTAVKSVADGVVVFAEWTTDTGYVIIIEHEGSLLSAYKHNGTLSKRQGDLVKAGEVIASVGNTGELTTGPHLHFELWNNGSPVNPLDYIDFK